MSCQYVPQGFSRGSAFPLEGSDAAMLDILALIITPMTRQLQYLVLDSGFAAFSIRLRNDQGICYSNLKSLKDGNNQALISEGIY